MYNDKHLCSLVSTCCTCECKCTCACAYHHITMHSSPSCTGLEMWLSNCAYDTHSASTLCFVHHIGAFPWGPTHSVLSSFLCEMLSRQSTYSQQWPCITQGNICHHGADSFALLPRCMRAAELSMPRPQAALLDWRSLWQVSSFNHSFIQSFIHSSNPPTYVFSKDLVNTVLLA
jgi:hypothetical protein